MTGVAAVAVAVACGIVFFACASSESLVTLGSGVIGNDGGVGSAGFVAPDAPPIVDAVLQCPSSECSARYTTCPDSTFPCDVDIKNDRNHCGSCDAVCPTGSNGMSTWTTNCADGECRLLCDQNFADCNGKVEDGCEKQIFGDPENCGSCGFNCGAGVKCIAGKCGCPSGQIECDGKCTDVSSSDTNCGVCGNVCTDPDGGVAPPHMVYGCSAGQCGALKCVQTTTSLPEVLWTDCNNDLADGCEVDVAADDANCVTCGVSCAIGQKCATMLLHWPPFVGCACPGGQSICHGPIDGVANCVDITNSHENCGACGVVCAALVEACVDGICVLSCPAGTADCNGDHTDGFNHDGCETNTDVDPGHCGSCTTQCDGSIGQPCQAGKCATQACGGAEAGVTK
jgi:hypothetical protein